MCEPHRLPPPLPLQVQCPPPHHHHLPHPSPRCRYDLSGAIKFLQLKTYRMRISYQAASTAGLEPGTVCTHRCTVCSGSGSKATAGSGSDLQQYDSANSTGGGEGAAPSGGSPRSPTATIAAFSPLAPQHLFQGAGCGGPQQQQLPRSSSTNGRTSSPGPTLSCEAGGNYGGQTGPTLFSPGKAGPRPSDSSTTSSGSSGGSSCREAVGSYREAGYAPAPSPPPSSSGRSTEAARLQLFGGGGTRGGGGRQQRGETGGGGGGGVQLGETASAGGPGSGGGSGSILRRSSGTGERSGVGEAGIGGGNASASRMSGVLSDSGIDPIVGRLQPQQQPQYQQLGGGGGGLKGLLQACREERGGSGTSETGSGWTSVEGEFVSVMAVVTPCRSDKSLKGEVMHGKCGIRCEYVAEPPF